MTISNDDLMNSILASLDRIGHVKSEDIPGIDLYMDQVTTFMEQHMRASTRNPEEDKILTKTMINNYAKNDLLPPPIKKKYSKDHVLLLIFIYYFKGVLSISDIQTLLAPLTERYYDDEGKKADTNKQDGKKGDASKTAAKATSDLDLTAIYNEVFSLEKQRVEELKENLRETYGKALSTFTDVPEDEQAFLQKFSFICMLSYDVYVKKLLIEKIIDNMKLTADDTAAAAAAKQAKDTTKSAKDTTKQAKDTAKQKKQ